MKQYIFLGLVVLVVLGGVFFLAGDQEDREGGEARPDTSDFDSFAGVTLVDYQGDEVSLEEFRGQPLVINSWAVWCPFCTKELPDFAALQKEFGSEVTVVAVNRQESRDKAKGFTDELGITSDMLFLLDANDEFYRTIGGFSMPETIFVNSGGEIVVHRRGPMGLEEMREHAEKITE